MLSWDDNETMCRIGPDAKAGVAVRRYWTPALQSLVPGHAGRGRETAQTAAD